MTSPGCEIIRLFVDNLRSYGESVPIDVIQEFEKVFCKILDKQFDKIEANKK